MATMRRSRNPIDLRLKEMGKSRKWLAVQMGVSEQHIGRLCNNRILLNPNGGCIMTMRLKKALGVDLNYLVYGPK